MLNIRSLFSYLLLASLMIMGVIGLVDYNNKFAMPGQEILGVTATPVRLTNVATVNMVNVRGQLFPHHTSSSEADSKMTLRAQRAPIYLGGASRATRRYLGCDFRDTSVTDAVVRIPPLLYQ